MRHVQIVSLVFMLCFSALPSTASVGSTDAEIAARCFDEVREAARRAGTGFWGVDLYGPIIFVDPSTRRVLANQRDAEGLLNGEGRIFSGTLPKDVPIANTSTVWAGVRWAMMMWPLPDDRAKRVQLMIHESFHRVQPALNLDMGNPANAHLDTRDGRYLLRLEWRALAAALASKGAARRRAIADAVVFRAQRRANVAQAADEENALELNEGLAEYTGCALGAVSPGERALELLKEGESKPSYTRSFAYASGPAYGVLLDGYSRRWRRMVEPGQDLGQLLVKEAGIDLASASGESVAARVLRYDGAAILAAETARETARAERFASYRKRFVDGAVLRLSLVSVNVSFNPNTLEIFGDLGTIYPTADVVDVWGALHIGGGALLAPDWSAITLPAPVDPTARPVVGDGWTLDLAPGWRLAPGVRVGDYSIEKDPS